MDVRRIVLGQKNAEDPEEIRLPTEEMKINMGPSHPAMHGTVRMVLTLDGERVRDADIELGYMHRCFEKESEYATYTQIFPYTDRLNYVSPLLNNVGYALAVEKALGIDKAIPERAQYIRVMIGEMSRITDHLTCLGASAMELGAFTAFLYMLKCRDWIWNLNEELTGARLTHSYVRIGGVVSDLTPGFREKLRDTLNKLEKPLSEFDGLLTKNRIFRERMEGVGVYGAESAIADGWTGPCLRSTGVDYDVRKDHPYLVYDRLEFDVPVGTRGDNYDRYLVRMEEIRQSIRILHQVIDQIPPGPILIDDRRVTLPPKAEVYNTIEGMIQHFKLVMDGIKVPSGEVYGYTEGANGELGFYIVADSTGRPYKCHVRAPCYAIMQSVPEQIRGGLVSDVVPTFGMLNYIAGECER
ncbi:MAG: NADH-quinone oxidoreductase subunit D [Deltaproteobacteria bacterium]|nr:NADH-quinone oxidoreductase subunit D [Deltaproteobacteria bacterium]